MVHRGKIRAMFLLAVAAFWSALPAAACLLTGASTGQPGCCAGMSENCPMQGADVNGSCCQIQPRHVAAIPDAPIPSEWGQTPALAPHPVGLVALAAMTEPRGHAFAASPPGISPGASAILRI